MPAMKVTSKSLAFAVIGTTALLSTFSANAAQAASVSYSANTGDYLETDWTKTLTVRLLINLIRPWEH